MVINKHAHIKMSAISTYGVWKLRKLIKIIDRSRYLLWLKCEMPGKKFTALDYYYSLKKSPEFLVLNWNRSEGWADQPYWKLKMIRVILDIKTSSSFLPCSLPPPLLHTLRQVPNFEYGKISSESWTSGWVHGLEKFAGHSNCLHWWRESRHRAIVLGGHGSHWPESN